MIHTRGESMIHFRKGDATRPPERGDKIIVHCCNDIGAWGAGFVLALSKRWPWLSGKYKKWVTSAGLGDVQLVRVENDIYVANLVGQRGIGHDEDGLPPVRYEAIEAGMGTVVEYATVLKATVHMPRMGCGLAGGQWDQVEAAIKRALNNSDVEVFVYDF